MLNAAAAIAVMTPPAFAQSGRPSRTAPMRLVAVLIANSSRAKSDRAGPGAHAPGPARGRIGKTHRQKVGPAGAYGARITNAGVVRTVPISAPLTGVRRITTGFARSVSSNWRSASVYVCDVPVTPDQVRFSSPPTSASTV